MRRKKVTKLYNKIMQIVTKGSESMIDYYNFIEDTITNGDYTLLEDVFSTCFNTDITKYNSITEFKKKSFLVVLTFTYSYFQIDIKEFYDKNDVYQIGKGIYELSTNNKLGEFTEQDRVGEVFYEGVTYSYYPENAYYRNTDLFRKLDETKVVELIVLIGDSQDGKRVLLGDPNMQLIDKYKYGVSILKNSNVNEYIDLDYVYNYYI